jgi:hypothetical protein
MLMILPAAKVLVPEDLVILMRQLVGHVLLIKQARQSSIKFQNLGFVYVVAQVLDGYLVFILLCFTQQRLGLCATSAWLVHHAHALPLNQCVLLIVVTILYSTCQWHLNVR